MKIAQVEGALAKLWDAHTEKGALSRVSIFNLVAICTDPTTFDEARAVTSKIMAVHPGRAVVVRLGAKGDDGITASVELVPDSRRKNAMLSELIVIDVSTAARDWVPPTIDRLLVAGARVNLWWIGDLPDRDTLYDRLTQSADVILLNSEDMDLRDLGTLSRLVDGSQGRYLLSDLGWARLHPWRELLARFFDDPSVLPELAKVNKLSLNCNDFTRGEIAEPTSTQAGLFAAWFASRVGAQIDATSWKSDSSDVQIPRKNGSNLSVSFTHSKRLDVAPGVLLKVELATETGAQFEVGRAEDPRVLGWQGSCAGAVIPPTVIRIDAMDHTFMVARQLESSVRDDVYFASLTAAAKMISTRKSS